MLPTNNVTNSQNGWLLGTRKKKLQKQMFLPPFLFRDVMFFNSLYLAWVHYLTVRHGNVCGWWEWPDGECIVDQDEFVEMIETHFEYLIYPSREFFTGSPPILIEMPKRKRTFVCQTQNVITRAITIQDKVFDLKMEECMSASTAGKQLRYSHLACLIWIIIIPCILL